MPTLCVALLVKDEASKFLASWLEATSAFADKIVALDDHSADNTPQLLKANPKVAYFEWNNAPIWGKEAPARRTLLELSIQQKTDWIMVLDADMLPLRDPKELMLEDVDAIAFRLFDMWSENAYREDNFWQAHFRPRIWATRTGTLPKFPEWPSRGIHCGHFPLNFRPKRVILGPEDYSLLHYAYANYQDRVEKSWRYQSQFDQMSEQEIAHAKSILDLTPTLQPLNFEPEWRLQKLAS